MKENTFCSSQSVNQ